MLKKSAIALSLPIAAFLSTSVEAAVLKLEGYSSSVQTVNVQMSPVPNTSSRVGATGFRMSDTAGVLDPFLAWCLDINHYLMSKGASQNYTPTDDPFYNSYGLTDTAKSRVQSVFDANYGSLNPMDADQAAAFQMVLWEAAYESDNTALSMTTGAFKATSSGSDGWAQTFIDAAAAFTGPSKFSLTFWEVEGEPDRWRDTGQNLVSASPIPLPAAGWLLLAGLGGMAALRRRN